MTALASLLKAQIATTGPMTLAEYMTTCLLHPEHGYYTQETVFGASGDFVTAPEVSQMFGELIGLCLAQTWLDGGAANRIALVELGPGRGTLMSDAQRAMQSVPGLTQAAEVHLVEASPAMRAIQAQTLNGVTPVWHDTVETLPDDIPLYVIANEYFDALPIRQFQRDQTGWREAMVGLSKEGALKLGLSDAAPVASLHNRLQDTEPGHVVETRPAAEAILSTLSRKISSNGGAALVIDYGNWRLTGDSFQAVRNHEPVDPLSRPGTADLTAHVDFEPLGRVASKAGCRHSALTPQGLFLERLGITPRAQALASKLSGTDKQTHIAAHRRLTHPDEMGTLFKVLGIVPADSALPPGLEP